MGQHAINEESVFTDKQRIASHIFPELTFSVEQVLAAGKVG
jgi:Uma2 family endonuclease